MDNLVNNAGTGINAAIYYFTSAVALLVKNPVFLGASVFMILLTGKSFQVGKNLKAKG